MAGLHQHADVIHAGLLGTLPYPVQTVPRDEIFAGSIAVELLVDFNVCHGREVAIVSDNKSFVDYANSDRADSLSSSNADLWARYWQAFDLLGVRVRIIKVKAHLSAIDVWAGACSWRAYIGNACADALAGQGASLAKVPCGALQDYTAFDKTSYLIRARLVAIVMALRESGASWYDQDYEHELNQGNDNIYGDTVGLEAGLGPCPEDDDDDPWLGAGLDDSSL